MDPALIARIDERVEAGAARSRAAFIARAVEAALGQADWGRPPSEGSSPTPAPPRARAALEEPSADQEPHEPAAPRAFVDREWTLGHAIGCKCSRCTAKRQRAMAEA